MSFIRTTKINIRGFILVRVLSSVSFLITAFWAIYTNSFGRIWFFLIFALYTAISTLATLFRMNDIGYIDSVNSYFGGYFKAFTMELYWKPSSPIQNIPYINPIEKVIGLTNKKYLQYFFILLFIFVILYIILHRKSLDF